jgi:enoyl-CoA hydratase/carnithine racemase
MTPELSIHKHLATITLRRPRQANRLQPQDLAVIAEHIAQVNAQAEVLVLRFESTGKYFCSGFDINQMDAAHTVAFDELVNAVEDARPVTMAAIQGGVYGGATDLALACDFRIGTPHVDMFMPAARLGLHFYQRGLERYVSRLGLDTAMRLFLTAEKISADEMKACGFLTHLVDADALGAAADNLSNTLAGMAPLALLGMKKHLNAIGRGVLDVKALKADMARAAASTDIKEGAAAWAEKREPKFTGR